MARQAGVWLNRAWTHVMYLRWVAFSKQIVCTMYMATPMYADGQEADDGRKSKQVHVVVALAGKARGTGIVRLFVSAGTEPIGSGSVKRPISYLIRQ